MNFWNSLSSTAKMVAGALAAIFVGLHIFLAIFYFGPFWFGTHTPTQPIAFSHKLHAGTNKIPCQYCHTLARRTEAAGIPSAEKCMNCHGYVKAESPLIVEIAKKFENKEPIVWQKVFDLPDHVWFNHKRHIKKGFKCQRCHGPIEKVDVVGRSNDFKMGFCIGCHRDNEAPTDCWTCHT